MPFFFAHCALPGCLARIRWSRSLTTGRTISLDEAPSREGIYRLHLNGDCTLLVGQSLTVVRASGEPLYQSHSATCAGIPAYLPRKAVAHD